MRYDQEQPPAAGDHDELPRLLESLTGSTVVGDTGWMHEQRVEEDRRPAPRWIARDVAIVLPIAEMQTMWERARRFDVDRGGRLDVRAAAILIWSKPDLSQAEPIGTFYVDWHTPGWDEATIRKVEWEPVEGGTEEEVWRTIELLAGRPLR